MGLSALALESNPVFPTYPERIPANDVTAGLVLPNAAVALLGTGGAGATLLLIFMAVTSAMSAELIAVSSIWTYDIYQTYINDKASGKQLITISHCSCVVYSIIMAGFSTGLFYAGVGMGWLYLFMGVIIGSAVLPATLCMMWSDQNWIAASLSPVLGLICAVIAWLVTAKKESGVLTVDSTGANNPMLAGNVVALLSPLIFVPVLTYAFGRQRYDWQSMKQIRKGDDSALAAQAHMDLEQVPGEQHHTAAEDAAEQAHLKRAAVIARSMTVFMAVSLLVLWPMPMYGSKYIFSKKFFTGWVVVGILWLFCSSFAVGVFPIWESRKTWKKTTTAMWRDLTGKGPKPQIGVHVRDSEEEERESEVSGEKVEPKAE